MGGARKPGQVCRGSIGRWTADDARDDRREGRWRKSGWVQNDPPRAATFTAPCGGFAGSYLKQAPFRRERGGVRIITTRHGGWCLRGVAQPSARVCDPDLARGPNSHEQRNSTFAKNLLTTETRTTSPSPHLDAPSLVAQSPSAMLSLSRAARASATSRATAASLSATRSYHKNVRVTQPPRVVPSRPSSSRSALPRDSRLGFPRSRRHL